ncbi:Bug family tripartite tricarboxylate transporter substrate binding protein [Falsiroseomonas oryzae]|uniref:Bug family tripartite tricarboxylate transporter substrate binding protein n=1 Tax=Falsiroseomonas oryzae TaxID=2766473 RepID=UPI0022EAAC66|nr:tripartite tricarboxylate transporter substrate binding protein [Roseomonas sp. MO-31]
MRDPHQPQGPGRRGLLALSVTGLAVPGLLRAQDAFPSRPIRVIVPYGTGGATDVTMRVLAPKLSEILGQPVVVENRVGSGGTVGTNFVARSAPDGYTLVCAALSAVALAVHLYRNLPYDPLRDLTAIAPTVFVPLALAATTRGWNVRTAQELVAELRAHPGRYHYASNGVGTTSHLAGANFVAHTGTQVVHVPYRSAGAAFTALLAGEVQFTHEVLSALKPHAESGGARVLFVASDRRSPVMPDVPTLAEAGLPPYKAYSWFGLFGPAGMPPEVVTRIANAVERALSDPETGPRLESLDAQLMRGYTPQRFTQYLRDEIVAWEPLIAASGAKVE